MNGQSEKTEQTTRRESPAKEAEEVSSEDEKEKSRWIFLRKITMGKKVFQWGQMVWGGLKKMMQTKKSLGQPGNHGWHGKSCVCTGRAYKQ